MKALIVLVVFFAACTRSVYVPQTHVEYRDRVERDSIFVRDSTLVYINGDTVTIWRDRWLYKDRFIHDTVHVRDTVTVTVEVVKEVRHVPTIYRYSLWIAIGAVLWLLWPIVKKLLLR